MDELDDCSMANRRGAMAWPTGCRVSDGRGSDTDAIGRGQEDEAQVSSGPFDRRDEEDIAEDLLLAEGRDDEQRGAVRVPSPGGVASCSPNDNRSPNVAFFISSALARPSASSSLVRSRENAFSDDLRHSSRSRATAAAADD
mmetsp:Transcript_48784/g.146992  ORF Transcript_48784/g.146992 Transcript_48784/m.146992 type:complete len:142 (-) Transcript_48784:1347-1772(-)